MTGLDLGLPAAAGALPSAVPGAPVPEVLAALVPAVLAALAVAVAIGLPGPGRLSDLQGDMSVGQRSPYRDRGGELPSGPTEWSLPPSVPHMAAPIALAAALLVLSGPAAAGLGLLLTVLARKAWGDRLGRRAREAERAGASEALAVLAGELTAGRTPATALDAAASVAVGPFAQALAAAARSGRFGADAGECLLRDAEQSAVPEVLRGLAACWQVCGSTGSSLATAVGRLAEGLRAEHTQRLAVEAELAGPRATAGLLAMLPAAGIALAAGLGARPVHVLFETPIGVGCLLVGVGLDLLGVWWTGRLVAAAGGRG